LHADLHTAYDHLQGRLGCGLEFLGEQRVKNIERPLRVYRVALDSGRPGSRKPSCCAGAGIGRPP
jgi:adenylate cyclase